MVTLCNITFFGICYFTISMFPISGWCGAKRGYRYAEGPQEYSQIKLPMILIILQKTQYFNVNVLVVINTNDE